MLTHIVQATESSVFLIDEPDVYLHADLQRQLVDILKGLGPDIILATHSTEIISECDAEEVVVVDKARLRARRLRSPNDLGPVFAALGSSANPILTQLAKTRRALFVEGGDFKLISRFAAKLGHRRAAVRGDFAVVPIEGFNPDRVKSLKKGMEHPLGRSVLSGAILDRDYRASAECSKICGDLLEHCELAIIHERKEIENFVLVPEAIDRAIRARIRERQRASTAIPEYESSARVILERFADEKKAYVQSQFVQRYRTFHRQNGSARKDETLLQEAIEEFDERWRDPDEQLKMIPGKDALAYLNSEIQERFKVSVSPFTIVERMRVSEVPEEMRKLVNKIEAFAAQPPPN